MKILENIRKAPSFLTYVSISFLFVAAGEARADLNYTTNDGALTVESYTGTNAVVVIPATFDDLPVVSLGDAAFKFDSVASVTIPASVTNIGQYVFEACAMLTNAPIPSSVVSIGNGAFAGCSSLTSIIIPDSVTTLGVSAFATCSSATNIVLTTNITAIPADAFDNCSSLESFTIPNEITSIGTEAFGGCQSLANIVIPTNVTTLGSSAFSGAGLRSITIPASVTSIGVFEFDYCTYLMAINVDPANPNYSSAGGVLFDKNQDTLIAFPGGVTGSYTIPDTVAAIGNNAFENCADLYTVTIPPSVTSIGSYAFSDCTDLEGVYCQGNAPTFSFDVFEGVSPAAAVYYLPGTTGWSSTFASLPTKMQNAPPQISAVAIQNKLLGFTCSSSSNQVSIVQACTNLANPIWVRRGEYTKFVEILFGDLDVAVNHIVEAEGLNEVVAAAGATLNIIPDAKDFKAFVEGERQNQLRFASQGAHGVWALVAGKKVFMNAMMKDHLDDQQHSLRAKLREKAEKKAAS